MNSSYLKNDYASIFRAIVSCYEPKKCVELGVLEGYSTIAIAQGLKTIFDKGYGRGHLTAYDLFTEYEFHNAAQDLVQKNIDEAGVGDFITLNHANALTVHRKHEDNSVDLLHVDLSNCGDIIRTILKNWDAKMVQGGIICFEGGTEDRDQVEWMKKYKRESLKREFETNPIIEEKYVFGTYMKFPGLTCLLKKR